MANLYGWVSGDRSKTDASRLANDRIEAAVEDWNGRVSVVAYEGGTFRVYLANKDGSNKRLLGEGNTYTREFAAVG